MTVENTTANQGYDLPYRGNPTAVDVERIINALSAIDADVAGLLAALVAKASLNSPAFTGTPTAPTQVAGTNNNTLATTGHVQLALEAFLSEAAGALDTIAALEAALGDADLATALLDQLALKAPIDSPGLTGVPLAPTASTATNSTQIATTEFVQAVKALIVSSAPDALNTLAKIATAIGNDPNFAATVSSILGNKAPLDSPTFTGNPTVPTQSPGNNSTRAASTAFVTAAIALALAAAVQPSRAVSTGTGLTGGGDLSADRTLAINIPTTAEAKAGSINNKVMTPLRTAEAIGSLQACRAWVNFNGNTGAIRDSYNVSSITDLGVGDYRINFASAMPNSGYAVVIATDGESSSYPLNSQAAVYPAANGGTNPSTTSVRICTGNSGNGQTKQDKGYVNVAVFA